MRRVIAASTILNGGRVVLATAQRSRGDFGFNVFHNSNPQHGGAYTRFERRMSDDEFEDFLSSVKGWEADMDTQAISKKFTFDQFDDAYRFVGRLYAFCYGLDKFPPVKWTDEGKSIEVSLYSPTYKGLSKREAKVAAFMNDHYNMLKKAKLQQSRMLEMGKESHVSSLVGKAVEEELAKINAQRVPVPEATAGRRVWDELIQR